MTRKRYFHLRHFLFAAVAVAAMLFLCAKTSEAWESYVGRNIIAYVTGMEEGGVMLASVKQDDLANAFPIKFYGIGVPTAKQPFGEEARRFIRELMPNGTKIVVTIVNEDKNGVSNALVQLGERSVNNRLVEEGLAWVDRSTCKAFFCRRWHIQESLAIKDRRGLWALNITTPPWQWGEVNGSN